jgi:predicted phage tail protein
MNYTKTKETLDNLRNDLIVQFRLANEASDNGSYKAASKILSLALGKADRELLLATKELALPFSGLEQEKKTRSEVEDVKRQVHTLVNKMNEHKRFCDQKYTTLEVIEEKVEAQERIADINHKRDISQQFERSFSQLFKLKEQIEPLVGVEDELNAFLKKVKELRMDGSVSVVDLTKAMNAAYDRLTGGSKEKFDQFTDKMHATHSVPLKLLGSLLVVLGAALVVSAILFAPAVIMAASTGLGIMYLATAGVAAGSSALSIGGASCFFAKTNRMELADIEHDLGNRNFEEHPYTPVAPGA